MYGIPKLSKGWHLIKYDKIYYYLTILLGLHQRGLAMQWDATKCQILPSSNAYATLSIDVHRLWENFEIHTPAIVQRERMNLPSLKRFAVTPHKSLHFTQLRWLCPYTRP